MHNDPEHPRCTELRLSLLRNDLPFPHGGFPLPSNKKRYASLIKFREFVRCNLARIRPGILTWPGCKPLYANLRLTHKCSAMCKSCTHWQMDGGNELSTDEWKAIIAQLKEADVLGVSFTGGDVLLRDDFLDLVKFSIQSGLKVNATINGFTLTDEIAKNLLGTNLDALYLSLDDMGDDWEGIRGVSDAAGKVLSALRSLQQYRNGTTRMGVAMTIMKDTLKSMREVVSYALQHDLCIQLNLMHFTHYFSDTSFSHDQYELDDSQRMELLDTVNWLAAMRRLYPALLPPLHHLEWVLRYFSDYRQKDFPCYKTMLKICIEPDGSIRPCCSMPPAGNIMERNLKTIVRSQEYIGLVKKGLQKECPGCSCHYGINVDAMPSSHLRAILLRAGMARLRAPLKS